MKDFRPINGHGASANRHTRRATVATQPLYRVQVETSDGNLLPVGPAMIKDAAEQFCAAIGVQIGLGKEKSWSSPHIVRANTIN